MELAPIVLTAIVILAVIQVITYIALKKTIIREARRVEKAIPPSNKNKSSKNKKQSDKNKRGYNNKKNKDRNKNRNRPNQRDKTSKPGNEGEKQQEKKQKPRKTEQKNDASIDNSLKDINMRLKKAEKAQEKSRKSVGSNSFQKGTSNSQKPKREKTMPEQNFEEKGSKEGPIQIKRRPLKKENDEKTGENNEEKKDKPVNLPSGKSIKFGRR